MDYDLLGEPATPKKNSASGGLDLFEKRSKDPKTLNARQILAAWTKAWTGRNTTQQGNADAMFQSFDKTFSKVFAGGGREVLLAALPAAKALFSEPNHPTKALNAWQISAVRHPRGKI